MLDYILSLIISVLLMMVFGTLIVAKPKSNLFLYICIKIFTGLSLYLFWPFMILMDISNIFFHTGRENCTAKIIENFFSWRYKEFIESTNKEIQSNSSSKVKNLDLEIEKSTTLDEISPAEKLSFNEKNPSSLAEKIEKLTILRKTDRITDDEFSSALKIIINSAKE